MGLYGAIIVLPASRPSRLHQRALHASRTSRRRLIGARSDFRLAQAAYDHPETCYDREYLFQFSEMDPEYSPPGARCRSRQRAIARPGAAGCSLNVPTEPYHPAYFMINGRSMPDDMDPNYAVQYPHQPYNGNPHMHPGELTLLRDHRSGHGGNIRSTSTATTCASWRATGT